MIGGPLIMVTEHVESQPKRDASGRLKVTGDFCMQISTKQKEEKNKKSCKKCKKKQYVMRIALQQRCVNFVNK